jgi:hypothetical protein
VRDFEFWKGVCKRRETSGGLSEITPIKNKKFKTKRFKNIKKVN